MRRTFITRNNPLDGPRQARTLLAVLLVGGLALGACQQDTEADKVVPQHAVETFDEVTGLEVAAGSQYRGKLESHADKCCYPAKALEPIVSTQVECSGKRWDDVTPGLCLQKKDKVCTTGLETRVTVKEYSLQWDAEAKSCVLTATGKEDSVQAATCIGGSCFE